MTSSSEPLSILFVCLGNICRSPLAEGVFRAMVSKPPYDSIVFRVDSCGTGAYHQGASPDSRTMATLQAHGINNFVHSARKIEASDFKNFQYILAMDLDNLRHIQRFQKNAGGQARVLLFGEFSGKGRTVEIEDPYYGGQDGFEKAFEQVSCFSKNFLEETFPEVAH